MISYVDNGFDTVVKYLTKEKLDEILASDYQHQLVERIRKELDHDRRSALKVKLRAMVPMGYPDHDEYLHYTESYQTALQAVPEGQREAWAKRYKKSGYRKIEFFRPSGLFMIDVDHCQVPPQQVFAQFCEAMRSHQIELKGFLAWASVTASGDGLRLILRGRKGSDIVKDQLWLAELAGLNIDEACKDITRLSFLTIAEDTLYRDDALLFARPSEAVYQNAQLGKWQTLIPGYNKPNSVNIQNNTNTPNQDGGSSTSPYPTTYHGFSFDEILRAYWLLNNHGHEPMHGDRDTLTFQLACDLRHICGNDFGWLNAVIPCYDGFPQAQKEEKIRNALTSTFNAIPLRMSRMLDYLEKQDDLMGLRGAACTTTGTGTWDDGTDCESEEKDKDALPPEMPQTLPPLISLLLSRTPQVYRPAVAHAVFPSLAAHLHRTTFRYIDNVLHEATLMNELMAGTGAGKECISAPSTTSWRTYAGRMPRICSAKRNGKMRSIPRGRTRTRGCVPRGW